MINDELVMLLSEIQEGIKRNELKSYKNFLYLLFQNNEMENNQETAIVLNDFIKLLFTDNIITEDKCDCGQDQCDLPVYKHGLTYGKEKEISKEPIDFKTMGQFSGLLPFIMRTSIEGSVHNRFDI